MDAAGLQELFAPFGPVTARRMFGGHGVYADGLCFALDFDGEIYLKCDVENQPTFVAAGSRPFTYMAKGKPVEVGFWRLVEEAYDDPEALKRWASLGLEAARRAAAKKGKAKGRARKK